jgi:hypothetical protein
MGHSTGCQDIARYLQRSVAQETGGKVVTGTDPLGRTGTAGLPALENAGIVVGAVCAASLPLVSACGLAT